MSRNSSGTYTLPAGNPVVTATTISTTWANSTLGDLATEITDSASRSGKGGFTAPVRGVDGSVAAPAVSFTSEPGTGWYRAAAGDLRLAIAGVDLISFKNNVMTLLIAGNPIIQASGVNSALSMVGNRSAADTGTDASIAGTATRTAGDLLQIQNGGSLSNGGLGVSYQGLLRLGAQAAAIQPASLWTAITPDTNIVGTGSQAYAKDATGRVNLKGGLTNNTGGVATSFVTTNPLPAGFRPLATRTFPGALSGIGAGSPVSITISPTGAITTLQTVPNGITLSLDAVSFIAEQ